MLSKLSCALIVFLFTLPVTQLLAKGKEVHVFLTDGRIFTGELVSVRDTALLIAFDQDPTFKEFATPVRGISLIPSRRIWHVQIKGHSVTVLFAAVGFWVGGWVGSTAGVKERGQDLLCGLVGVGIGALVGGVASTSDLDVEPAISGDLFPLKPFGRYSEKEPDFLQVIK